MDKYVKIRKIGEGSFGTACLVRSKQNGEHYVVKDINIAKMNAKEREESRKEVAVLAQLNHPTIITYLESFEERGSLYIVMDYCSGGDLYQKINQQRGVLFPEDQILDWFVQVSLALKHIHDRKILHRDIKSQNIFLTMKGTVKLGDFGIAKILNSTVELSRTCIGTPYYLSPEIVENKPYNNKSDIWSLGCVLYELTTLKHAFESGNMKNLVLKIIRGNYPPVSPKYSYELRNLINVLFKRMPRERPTVNAVLKKPFLQPKIQRFLTDAQIADEFSHTVMHGAKLRKRIPTPISARPNSAQPPRRSQTPLPTPGRAPPRYDPAAVYGQPMVKRSREARRSAEQLNRRPGSAGAALNPVQDLERRRREMMEREQKRRQEILRKREQMYKQQHKELVDKQQADRMNKMREEGWKSLISSLESNEEKAVKSKESLEKEPQVNNVISAPSQPGVSESRVPLKDRGNYDKYHQFLNKFQQDGENRQRDAQQRLNKGAYMQASESEESMETDYSDETPAQQAVRQAQNNRQLAEQAAERAKLVEDYLHRKRQAKLHKARAQVDIYSSKPQDAAPLPQAGQKRPVSAREARNKEEQEYLENLRKIRLQNFNERRMLKGRNGSPAQDLAKYKLDQREEVKKKVEALKAQADERIHQHKQRFEQQRREASERQRQLMGERPKQPASGHKAPVKCVNMKAAPGMQITSILQAIGADEALSQEDIPSAEIEKQKVDILKRINAYPPEEAPNSARSQWDGVKHGDFTMAQLPLEQTASAMEETCDLNPAMMPSPLSSDQESEQPVSARRHWRSSPGQTVLSVLQQAEICSETLSMSSGKSDNSTLSQSGSDNTPVSLMTQNACTTNVTANTTVSTAITTTVSKPPVAPPVSFVIGINTSTPTTAAPRIMGDTVTVSVAPSPIPKPRVKHSTIVLSKSEISAPGIPNIAENEIVKNETRLDNSDEESIKARLSSSPEKLPASDEESVSPLSENVADRSVLQQSHADDVNVERTETMFLSDSVIETTAQPSEAVLDSKKTEAVCSIDNEFDKLLAMNFEADVSREVGVNRTEAVYSTDNTETDVPEVSLENIEARNDRELVSDSVSVKAWLSPSYSESEPTPVQTSPSSVSQAETTPSSDPQSSRQNLKPNPRTKPLLFPKPRVLPNPSPSELDPVKTKETTAIVKSEGAGSLFDMVELDDDDDDEVVNESRDKPSTADKPSNIGRQPPTEVEKNAEEDQSVVLGLTIGQFDVQHSELLRTCSEPDLTRLFSSIKTPDVACMSDDVKHSPTSKSLDLLQNREVSLHQLSPLKSEKLNTVTSKTAQTEHSELQSNNNADEIIDDEIGDDKPLDGIAHAPDDGDNDDIVKDEEDELKDEDFDDDEFEDLLNIQASMATLLKSSDDDEDDDGNFVPFSLSDSSLGEKTKIPKHRTSQNEENGDDNTKGDGEDDDDHMMMQDEKSNMSSDDDDDEEDDTTLRSSASGDASSAGKMTLNYSDLFGSDDSDDDDDDDDEGEGDDYDIFSRLEESRMELEEELGCEAFLKVYRSIQALHEDEDENIEDGARVAMEMLGDKQHLYPKVFQLVLADSVFTEDNS